MSTILSPNILVNAQLYDSLGRPVAKTITAAKAVPANPSIINFVENFVEYSQQTSSTSAQVLQITAGQQEVVTIPTQDPGDEQNISLDFWATETVNFTIEFWVKITQLPSRTRGIASIISKQDIIIPWIQQHPDWKNVDLGIFCPYIIGINADGNIIFGHYGIMTTDPADLKKHMKMAHPTKSQKAINDNSFHHIALVCSGTTATLYTATLYIDGEADPSSSNLTWPTPPTLPSGDMDPGVLLGPVTINGGVGDFGDFGGQIFELRFWNINRTQAQINQYMNSRLTDLDPADKSYLQGYWPFDGDGNDYSGNYQSADLTKIKGNPFVNAEIFSIPAGGPIDTSSALFTWAWPDISTITDLDRQYPYSQCYLGGDPLARPIGASGPGVQFNHASDLSLKMTNDCFPSGITFPSSLGLSTSDVPQFYAASTQQTSLGSNGLITKTLLQDFWGRTIATMVTNANTGTLTNLLTRKAYQIGAQSNLIPPQLPTMATTTISLPNYFDNTYNNTQQCITTQVNALGKALIQNRPEGGITNNFYDVYGRLRFTQTADQASLNTVIYYLYDALNRPIQIGFLTMAWNITSFQKWTMPPDASQSLPLGSPSPKALYQFIYDQNNTNQSSFVLESMGQLIQINHCNTSISGTTVQVNSQTHLNTQYTYDGLGRITQWQQTDKMNNSYMIAYQYDCVNNVNNITYPQNTLIVYYKYNIQNKISAIGTASQENAYASYQYNEFGQITQENLGTNCQQSLSYTYGNTLNQLTQLSDSLGLLSFSMTYTDPQGKNYQDGNIQLINYTFNPSLLPSVKNYSYTYSYDGFNRLSGALCSNSDWSLSNLQFDANGNLQSLTTGQETPENIIFSYASLGSNCLASVYSNQKPTYMFEYSGSGLTHRLIDTTNTTVIWTYDLFSSRPVQITINESNVDIIYDAKGERYQKTVDGTTVTYIRGLGAWPLTEISANPTNPTIIPENSTIHYIYGPKGLIVIHDGSDGTNYIVQKDHLGSTQLVYPDVAKVDASAIIAYFNYLPYGELMSGNSSPPVNSNWPIPIRYLYTGQEWDNDLGLYNYHARQYHPQLGRFLTPDPAHQFASPYVYCGNNPINATDPTGRIIIRPKSLEDLIEAIKKGPVFLGESHTQTYARDATIELINKNLVQRIFFEALPSDLRFQGEGSVIKTPLVDGSNENWSQKFSFLNLNDEKKEVWVPLSQRVRPEIINKDGAISGFGRSDMGYDQKSILKMLLAAEEKNIPVYLHDLALGYSHDLGSLDPGKPRGITVRNQFSAELIQDNSGNEVGSVIIGGLHHFQPHRVGGENNTLQHLTNNTSDVFDLTVPLQL